MTCGMVGGVIIALVFVIIFKVFPPDVMYYVFPVFEFYGAWDPNIHI